MCTVADHSLLISEGPFAGAAANSDVISFLNAVLYCCTKLRLMMFGTNGQFHTTAIGNLAAIMAQWDLYLSVT